MNTTTIILLMTSDSGTLPRVAPYVQTATSRLLALGIEASVSPCRDFTECRAGDEIGPTTLVELCLDGASLADLPAAMSKVEAGLKSLAKDVGHAIKFRLLAGQAHEDPVRPEPATRGSHTASSSVGC